MYDHKLDAKDFAKSLIANPLHKDYKPTTAGKREMICCCCCLICKTVFNARGIALVDGENFEIFSWKEISQFGAATHKLSNDTFCFKVVLADGSTHVYALRTEAALGIHFCCQFVVFLIFLFFSCKICIKRV